jgi:S1-C subfamily serine protease
VPNFAEVYNRVRTSVVEIRHGTSVGTGWAIEDGWIITNEHVVESATTVAVRIPVAPTGSRTLTGIVRGRDTRRDLAAIQVDHGLTPLPRRVIGTTDGGLAVIQIGYSTGVLGFPAAKLGVVTAVFGHSGAALSSGISSFDPGAAGSTSGISIVVTDAAADPGDSGGPVLDPDGVVVGTIFGSIVFSGDKRVTGQQQAIGVKDINAVWPDLKRGIDTSTR